MQKTNTNANDYLKVHISSGGTLHFTFAFRTPRTLYFDIRPCRLDVRGDVKGQMQRNLDNFSFVEKPLQKRHLYQHKKEPTL